ncbi:OmpA family protein [Saprospira sp. CCB-QB6]|uniref:OmpA family protein n=1 Tax=Saprospira sp. CCB-QB6 TaxID=3023936 RepID=UPI00234B8A22|nr:OmpA family protein [Saprospira sp. CCB-QB6]WCL81521.1 OmpA family protein [Saprospira sp. CCB-QB6]
MRQLIFAAFLWALGQPLMAQNNLLKNPSFEEGCNCDDSTELVSAPRAWQLTAGQPNFFNPGCPLLPERKTYIQALKMPTPAEGKVYAGLGLAKEGEYLTGELEEPLAANKEYLVKMRLRRPIRFCYTPIDELGLRFDTVAPKVVEGYTSLEGPSLKLRADNGKIREQYQWQEVSAIYKAEGGERYLTLGNFSDNNEMSLRDFGKKDCAYIYIDWASVTLFKGQVELVNYQKGQDFKAEERIWLKEIAFETGTERLKAESLPILDELAENLGRFPQQKFEISGHSDNTGEEATNRIFSKARAESVVNYLVAKGISASQLTLKGRGSSQNINANDTAKRRANNWRIEIKALAQ